MTTDTDTETELPAEVVNIFAQVQYINCPKCDKQLEGWLGDPRGSDEVECEHCNHKFTVSPESQICLT